MTDAAIKSYNPELDRKIGPIKIPALCLVEGPNDSGKSVLVLQYCYGALLTGYSCYLLTTESSMKSVRDDMKSLSWDTTYHLLTGRLKVGEMHVKNMTWMPEQSAKLLKLITAFI
ncbi:MAG: ATPase domain-containing protein, partial [Candidatus Caldarchaeum sp.]|nr:ATPase domain-containing protein [Candidatus Caldarchaeum sp.]